MTIAGATIVAVLAGPAAAVAAPTDDLQGRLDAVVAAGAIGALAEVRDEHGVWRGVSGAAVRGSGRPVPVHGRFRVGSVTKTFVATVVLQLVAEGRVRLDDVRPLLDHTSGVPDYLPTLTLPPDPAFLDNRRRTWTPAELIERARAREQGTPGVFAYSNTNYLLLGQLIERVTGRPYAREIERRIIRPLGLRATSLPGTSPRIPGAHPHGYVPIEDRGLVDYTVMNPSVMGASGEMISTTADLNRFFGALLGGRLLPAGLLREMKTTRSTRAYGLGLAWWQHTTCGVTVYGNDGDALAYQTFSYATADRRRQATIAFTPDFTGDVDAAVDAFMDRVFCGT